MNQDVQKRDLLITLLFNCELNGGVHGIQSLDDLLKICRLGEDCENIVTIPKPCGVMSNDGLVVILFECFHKEWSQDSTQWVAHCQA